MDWNDLKLLIEVHRSGSFAAAAGSLAVNSATVSRRISAIEGGLGAKLFRRTPFGVNITPIGESLLRKAMRVEEEVQAFQSAMDAVRTHASRPVTLRCSDGVASYLMTPLMAKEELGPLGVAGQRIGASLPPITLMPPLDPADADIAIVWTPPEQLPEGRPTDKIRKLATIHFAPFFSGTYGRKAAAAAPERFEDLRNHKLITLSNYHWFDSGQSLAEWNHLTSAPRTEVVSTRWTSAMAELTLGGAGISLLPTYSPLYAGGYRRVEVSCPDMSCNLWIVAEKDNLKRKDVRNCYDTLTKVFHAFPW